MEKENYIRFARSQPHGKIIVEVINSRVQAEKKRNTFISINNYFPDPEVKKRRENYLQKRSND